MNRKYIIDEKMLKALEIDYEKGKVKVDLTKLYPNTPSLRDTPLQKGNYEVEFEDGTRINLPAPTCLRATHRQAGTKDLDYKLIKPLIWWE